MAGVIVLDAGILIAHLDTGDAQHEAATAVLEEHEEFDFAISAITLAECLVRPALVGRIAAVEESVRRLDILVLDVTAADAAAIAEVRAATGLRMPDAIALHAAERHAGILATTDGAVRRAGEKRGVEVVGP